MEENSFQTQPKETPKKKVGVWRSFVRFFRNLMIVAAIVIPTGYSVKLRLKLDDKQHTIDSLRQIVQEGASILDSLKEKEDQELIMIDAMDRYVDGLIVNAFTQAIMAIDTTIDAAVARRIIEENMNLDDRIDSVCTDLPVRIEEHIRLRYIQSVNPQIEKLNTIVEERFGQFPRVL